MKTVLLNLFKLYLLISEGTLRYRYLGYQELNVVYLLAVHLTFIGIGLAVLSTNREIDSWTCAYTLAIIFFIHTSAKNGNCYSYCNAFYPHCTQKGQCNFGLSECNRDKRSRDQATFCASENGCRRGRKYLLSCKYGTLIYQSA